MKTTKKLTPWRQEMADFPLAFSMGEWEALKKSCAGATPRMQHILREALCVYLAISDGDFYALPVSVLEKALTDLTVTMNRIEEVLELHNAEKPPRVTPG